MEWSDTAIVLSARRHGESSAIMSVLSAAHGRHSGLVRGGAGRRAQGVLQPGNRVSLVWRARLAEHLGTFTWEPLEPLGTRWLDDAARLAAIASACALTEMLLPEREPHGGVHDALAAWLTAIGGPDWQSLYVRWELGLLADLGFGLDLSRCAVTGRNDQLIYVSPKSGAAVSASAGEPYRDRLLPLPPFLLSGDDGTPAEIADGLRLTGYFLERHLLGPQGKRPPPARMRFIARIAARSAL